MSAKWLQLHESSRNEKATPSPLIASQTEKLQQVFFIWMVFDCCHYGRGSAFVSFLLRQSKKK